MDEKRFYVESGPHHAAAGSWLEVKLQMQDYKKRCAAKLRTAAHMEVRVGLGNSGSHRQLQQTGSAAPT